MRTEQDANAAVRGDRSQFLHMVVSRAVDAVDEWSAEACAVLGKTVDRVRDTVRFVIGQSEEPLLDLGVKVDIPAHASKDITAR
jgi:hypothetical protein